ncbi:hypothetical protein KRR38_00025 [Novosphingobium sp. G106]|nr:hypothetical protein [Novosphingobium sp. G106]
MLVSLAPGTALAKAPLSWPIGLFSNVRTSHETGDLIGLEVRFYEEAGRHMAELANCEGWCNETHVTEVTRGDSGFVLHYTEIFTGAQGDVPVEIRFVVWPGGTGLNFSTYQGGENIDPNGKPQRLRRATKLFGIAVAKSGKE